MNSQKVSNVNEKIGLKMAQDKDFCFSIMDCKDRNEVKAFLKSSGIDASDADVEDLAKNISEVADVCTKIDDDELEKIVGGQDTTKVWEGIGWGTVGVGAFGVLIVVASWIKKKGDEKGWWGTKNS